LNGIGVQNINGEERITFAEKLGDDIPDVFNARKLLFAKAYYHKKVYPVEYQIQEAIRLAAPHLKIRGADKKFRVLKDILTELIDIRGYINLDDTILTLIKYSEIDHEDIRKAKLCIEKIERRELHTSIVKIQFSDPIREKIEEIVKFILDKYSSPEGEKPLYVFRELHFGKGPNVDPMENVIFSPRSKSSHARTRGNSESQLKSETTLFIYGWYGIEPETVNEIYEKFQSELNQYENSITMKKIFGRDR